MNVSRQEITKAKAEAHEKFMDGVVLVKDLAEHLQLERAYLHSLVRKRHFVVSMVFDPRQPGRRNSAISLADARALKQEYDEGRRTKIVAAADLGNVL